jgi:hypothetical protein
MRHASVSSLFHNVARQASEKRRVEEKEKKYQAWLFIYLARLDLDNTIPAMI